VFQTVRDRNFSLSLQSDIVASYKTVSRFYSSFGFLVSECYSGKHFIQKRGHPDEPEETLEALKALPA
jgi:hypothetical protein